IPGGKPGNWYLPSPPVTDARCAPVCVLMAVTWAPGTPAREASVTVPEIEPEVVCAITGIVTIQHAMIGTSSPSIRFITTRTISLESAVGLARSHPEPRRLIWTRRGIHQNIGRLCFLMNQLPFVQPAECRCETEGEAQELSDLHWPRKESIRVPP